MLIYPIGISKSCFFAGKHLASAGYPLTDHPCPEITHLLLDIPSFSSAGQLRNGQDLHLILSMLPPDIRVIGGNLNHPALADYRIWDFLQDPFYTASNAEITADCAVRLAGGRMTYTYSHTPTLVIGWGRIGKCLCRKLQALGCRVTVAVRNPRDMAMIAALGFEALDICDISRYLNGFRLVFNTVPAPLPIPGIPDSCLALELASVPGLPEKNTISALALPGKLAPESSGKLIADTFIRYIKEEHI